ncbi:MAG: efflux RND transporter periplasmic adaptor subunit [Acidobacteriota bacterium]
MKRILTYLIAGVFLAFGGYRVWQAVENKKLAEGKQGAKKGAAARVISVATAVVRTGQVREEILITGSLKPKEQVDVTSKATGRVEKLTFYVGDLVKKGQVIAEIEDSELQQQVRRAMASIAVVKATLSQRKAELANAKADLERSRQLAEAGLIPRQEFDTKKTSFQVVQAQIELTEAQGDQAHAELSELKIRLEQMHILAPMDGYIADRFVDEGAVVSPSTPIVRLVNLSTMVTRANVPEREVSKLRVGNKAIVRVDAFGDQVFEGKVTRVSPVLDVATRSALVEVEIQNKGVGLKAEMFARVTLDLANFRQAVLIPREALVYRGQQPGVYTLSADNKPSFRDIEPGVTQGDDVEVLTNLSPGTRIVTKGSSMLSDGVQVRVAGEGKRKS